MIDGDSDSSPSTPAGSTPAGRPPGTIALLVVIGIIECVALLIYTVLIGVAAAQETDTPSSPVAEVVIYLLFVVGMAAVVRGLWRRAGWSRGPFIVIQLFGLVVAYTLFRGDLAYANVIGALVAAVSGVGLVRALAPATAAQLGR